MEGIVTAFYFLLRQIWYLLVEGFSILAIHFPSTSVVLKVAEDWQKVLLHVSSLCTNEISMRLDDLRMRGSV